MKFKIILKYTLCVCVCLSQEIPKELTNIIKNSGLSERDVRQIINDKNISNLNSIDNRPSEDFNKQNVESQNESNTKLINELMNDQSQDEILNEYDNDRNMDLENDEKNEDSDEVAVKNQSSASSDAMYFGYATFQNNVDLFESAKDISASPNHVIGPGDEIVIMLWGQTEDISNYIVSRDGYLFIPNIGQVFVNGLTLSKLEIKLKKIYQKAYSSLSPSVGPASTFFDVSLGSTTLKPIRIFVMGEVSKPGVYIVKPSTSLFSSLYYFGGPKISGSLRNIDLIRSDKKISSIDFYDFLLKGKKKNDVALQDGDVVFINSRAKTVKISGEINRAAIYELKEEENFSDLKNIFGGYLSTTYMKRARLDRIINFKDRIKFGNDRQLIDIDLADIEMNDFDKNFSINDGDIFTFFKIGDAQHGVVTIVGPINRPGQYSIGEGLKVSGLISKADGFSSSDLFRDRLEVLRSNSDGTQDLLTANLDSVLAKVPSHDFDLQNSDVVNLFSLSDRLYKDNISIEGYVLNPSTFNYIKGMTVFDLIFKGGGFENKERLENLFMDRADLFRVGENTKETELITFRLDSVLAGLGIANTELKMGDRIKIYSKEDIYGKILPTVQISGFVKNPGTYPITKNMKVSELLFLGSGLKDKNHANKLFFGRADLIRINENLITKSVIKLNLENLLKFGENDLDLKKGDRLIVYSREIFESFSNVASINGVIKNPGEYEIFDNMRLGDLILYAGGIDISLKNINIEISNVFNEKITNTKGPLKIADVSSYNVKNSKELYFGDDKKNILNYIIMPNDNVTIYSGDVNILRKVSISGEILYPGDYVLKTDEDNLHDIIMRAGGLTKFANYNAGSVSREGQIIRTDFSKIIKNKRSKYNIILADGDTITIPPRTGLVKITGAVMVPGLYQYFEKNKLKEYIKEAGGYDQNAAKLSTFVTHLNGKTEKIKLIGNGPNIYDGSIITVKYKEDVVPFNFTEYVTNLTSIYTDLVQAIAIVSIIGNN